MNNNLLDDNFAGDNKIKYRGYAGFWGRVGAKVIDSIVFIPVSVLFNFIIFRMDMLFGQVTLNILGLLYQPLMEWKYGATLGKMAVGLRVTNDNFGQITLEQSFIRSVFYVSNYIYTIILNVSLVYMDKIRTVSGISDMLVNGDFFEKYGMFAYLSMIIAFVILISCLFVAFDERKQALHDKIARTFCVMI